MDNSYVLRDRLIAKTLVMLNNYERKTLLEVTDYDVSKFVKTYVGGQFTPKDFRTLYANVLAWQTFESLPRELQKPTLRKHVKTAIRTIAEEVSSALCNTVTVVKKSYINSELFNYIESKLPA